MDGRGASERGEGACRLSRFAVGENALHTELARSFDGSMRQEFTLVGGVDHRIEVVLTHFVAFGLLGNGGHGLHRLEGYLPEAVSPLSMRASVR